MLKAPTAGLAESHVLEGQRLMGDAGARRSDPVRKLSGLDDATAHERLDERVVLLGRQPLATVGVPLVPRQHPAVRADVVAGEIADGAMESLVREFQRERQSCPLD